jgi:hypothetical protein
MPFSVTIWDGTLPGDRSRAGSVTLDRERVTLRELIRERVRQEVQQYNENLPEVFFGLVQPKESESVLNGYRMKTRRPLDWEAQYRKACSSFERNGFVVFSQNRQLIELDEEIELAAESEVQFVKLVPLVGG